jgi:selenocysteine lyase/cysteine desulfurase
MLNLAALRADTPACASLIHLNNAGTGLMPMPVVEAINAHLALEMQMGGYEAAAQTTATTQSVYEAVATLLGCTPRNIALRDNATSAYNQALSAIPFQAGDVILTTRNDYSSNQIAFFSLHKRFGVKVMHAPDMPEGGVDADAVRQLIRDHRPKLVAVTHIPTNSGLVQPVAEIGRLCREADVLYLVDGCQTAGQLPVNVVEIGCDFFSATGRKFLRGPRGTGFLYVSDRVLASGIEPLLPDMRGADWVADTEYRSQPTAQRFEDWEFSYALLHGLGVAARYAMNVGMEAIGARASSLAAQCRRELQAIDGVRVLDKGAELCAIVTFMLTGAAATQWDATSFKAVLQERSVNCSLSMRNFALLDFEQKGVDWAVRFSPHYYNTEEEITTATSTVAELLQRSV